MNKIKQIKYKTPVMTKYRQLEFKAFMDSNIKESPEITIIAFNQYLYEFKELTGEEFIKIQEWELMKDKLK